MLELSVRFTSDEKVEDSPISLSLFRPDGGVSTNPAPFEPPLDEPELADLRWYLEVFSSWPTGPDYVRAESIEAKLEDRGRALLESITADREAARLWQQFVDADAEDEGKLLTIDATDPRVLRLPWELLADDGGHIFSQGIGVRRRMQKTTTARVRRFTLPVRILGLPMPSGRGRTRPLTLSTYSERMRSASAKISRRSGSKTTCNRPSRSRRSMKITPP